MGILVGVEVAVGLGVRVTVGIGVAVGGGVSVGISSVRERATNSGIDVAMDVGGSVGNGTVGTKVGKTKTDTGSPLTISAPVKVPSTRKVGTRANSHLPRAIMTLLHDRGHHQHPL
jgi:hypothetical protein